MEPLASRGAGLSGCKRHELFPDPSPTMLPGDNSIEDEGVEGAILHDSLTGAVLYTQLTRLLDFEDISSSCPYDIPRKSEESRAIAKCTMCLDRVRDGLLPACVKACPTGAMNFGERRRMEKLAQSRLMAVKLRFREAQLKGVHDTRVFYLLTDSSDKYHTYV